MPGSLRPTASGAVASTPSGIATGDGSGGLCLTVDRTEAAVSRAATRTGPVGRR